MLARFVSLRRLRRRVSRIRDRLYRFVRLGMNNENDQAQEQAEQEEGEFVDALDEQMNEYEDDTDHEDEVEFQVITADSINYDLNLPGTHKYLGSDLTECISPEMVMNTNLVEMIVIRIPGVILIPYQKLPMANVTRACQEALLLAKSRGERIGILAEISITRPFPNAPGYMSDVSVNGCLGVAAEIVAIREGIRENFRAVLKGRERFRVVSFEITGIITRAQVELLPEASDVIGLYPLHDSIPNVYLNRLPRQLEYPIDEHEDCYSYAVAGLSSWPPHLFQELDVRQLRRRIFDKLISAHDSWRLVETINMNDHVEFSYWLIHNLLLPDSVVRNLLDMDHVVTRLHGALDILSKPLTYRCTRCGTVIIQHEHLICLAKEGALQTFVNPHGHHFDMITTQEVQHIRFSGGFHIEDSWFPGYSWKIMNCSSCSFHVGWMFKATEDRTLIPQYFYGLVRGSVNAQMSETTAPLNLFPALL